MVLPWISCKGLGARQKVRTRNMNSGRQWQKVGFSKLVIQAVHTEFGVWFQQGINEIVEPAGIHTVLPALDPAGEVTSVRDHES
jgi:hypothetical protein